MRRLTKQEGDQAIGMLIHTNVTINVARFFDTNRMTIRLLNNRYINTGSNNLLPQSCAEKNNFFPYSAEIRLHEKICQFNHNRPHIWTSVDIDTIANILVLV